MPTTRPHLLFSSVDAAGGWPHGHRPSGSPAFCSPPKPVLMPWGLHAGKTPVLSPYPGREHSIGAWTKL